jgi:hypothetical protein
LPLFILPGTSLSGPWHFIKPNRCASTPSAKARHAALRPSPITQPYIPTGAEIATKLAEIATTLASWRPVGARLGHTHAAHKSTPSRSVHIARGRASWQNSGHMLIAHQSLALVIFECPVSAQTLPTISPRELVHCRGAATLRRYISAVCVRRSPARS